MIRLFFAVTLIVSLSSLSARAQTCIGSQCGDGYTGCGCGEDSAECCRRHMMGGLGNIQTNEPQYSPPSYDFGAQQDYQRQQAEAEARRKREEEMERHRKEDAERERQRQFDSDKTDLEHDLKIDSNSDLNLKGYDAYEDKHLGKVGLKGEEASENTDVKNTEIKKKGPVRIQRHWGDLSSPVLRAWSQLYCGASLFGNDVSAARLAVSQADVERVSYLADQAIGALNGREYGEPCPAAPPMPRPEDKMNFSHDMEVKLYTALTQETQRQAARLVEIKKAIAQDKKKVSEAKKELAKSEFGESDTELKLKTSAEPEEGNARALAEAALKASQAALARSQADKDAALRRLDQLKNAGSQAAQNPDAINLLYASFSAPTPSKTGVSP